MVTPFDTQNRIRNEVPMKKKESKITKFKTYVKQKAQTLKVKAKDKVRSTLRTTPKSYVKAADKVGTQVKRVGSDIAKSFNAKDINKTQKKLGTAISRAFAKKSMSSAQLLALRKAQAARSQQLAMQTKASVEASGYDNKFERRLAALRFKMDEEERLRRFHETPKDFLIRRAALNDLKLQRDREMIKRHDMFKQHEMQPKCNLNFLGVDSTCNLARSQPIWRADNPDNNVFRDTGRPSILDTPNAFQSTNESRRWNILNAERLNFGKVDTTRRPRIKLQRRPEDNF